MRKFLIGIFAALLSGCYMAPSLEKQDLNITSTGAQALKVSPLWWQDFGDENLNAIVEAALKNNLDLALAMKNVEFASAALSLSTSDMLPSVSINAAGARQSTSGETLPKGRGALFNNFSFGGMLSYELDLWGRVASLRASAKAEYLAQEASAKTVRLAVIAGVVKTYYGLVALKMQEKIAQENLQSFDEILEYRAKQLKYGEISSLVFYQTKVERQSIKASLLSLQEKINAAQTQLAILTADDFASVLNKTFSLKDLPASMTLPAGLSSELLEQRPDLMRAQHELEAANYKIGAARAAYFPRISITGAFGFASSELSSLGSSNSQNWSAGAGASMPLFDFGKTSFNVDAAVARKEIALLNYRKTIRTALGEVKDAMTKNELSIQRQAQIKEQLGAQKTVLELASKKYDAGYISHLEFLDAKRGWLNVQLLDVGARLDGVLSMVDVYKSLGGGYK